MGSSASTVAYWTTFLCLALSAQFASGFFRHNPRLFTAMALLACNWALLLPAYASNHILDRAPLVAAVGGFLLVYIGGLLLLEAQTQTDARHEILGWQVVSMYLLLLLAAPAVPGIFGVPLPQITANQFTDCIVLALDVVGIGSIVAGIHKLVPVRGFRIVLLISIAYVGFETGYIARTWPQLPNAPMGDEWKYVFAVCKLAFTIALGFCVAYYEMSWNDRRRGPLRWIMLLLRLANADGPPARLKPDK